MKPFTITCESVTKTAIGIEIVKLSSPTTKLVTGGTVELFIQNKAEQGLFTPGRNYQFVVQPV